MHALLSAEEEEAGPPAQASPTTMLCALCYRRYGTESHLDEDPLGRLCEPCRRDLVGFIRLLIDSIVELRHINSKALVRILRALLSVGAR